MRERMKSSDSTRCTPCAVAASLLALACVSQPALGQAASAASAPGSSQPTLERVQVTGSATNSDGSTTESGGFQVPKQSFGPFGATPTLDVPFSTNAFSQELIRATLARDLSELGRNDPSFGNYALPSASGYATFYVRGFPVSGGATNHRVDGLPVSSQSGLVLDNFERVDLHKGLFGLLYGFGAPGGLINYVTKRPLADSFTEVRGDYSSDSQFGAAVDVSRRFGDSRQFGLRVNLSGVAGDTSIDGQRQNDYSSAVALDWTPVEGARLWSNLSYSRNALRGVQPGVFLGTFGVPREPDASTFLGVDFGGHIGRTRGIEGGFELQPTEWLSLRGTVGDFRAGRDVRYDGAFLTNDLGDFELSIFPHNQWVISDTSGEFAAAAKFASGIFQSTTSIAITLNKEHTNVYTVQPGVDLAGTSNLYEPIEYADPNEPYAAEPAYLSDQKYRNAVLTETLDITERVTLIAGAAFSRISLTSNDPERYVQKKTTPSLGVIVKPTPRLSLYGSYIRGLQAGSRADEVVGPAPVTNAGAYLAPFVSTQHEIGSKYQVTDGLLTTLALFRISRPIALYVPTTAAQTAYTFSDDGRQVNRGVEFNAAGRVAPELKLFGGVSYLRARIDRSQDGLLDGNRPIGIPKVQANLVAVYDVAPVPGFALIGAAHYKGSVEIDAANTRTVHSAATFDAGFKYDAKWDGRAATARFYVTNITDRDHWSASVFAPIVYLGDARTARFEVSTRF